MPEVAEPPGFLGAHLYSAGACRDNLNLGKVSHKSGRVFLCVRADADAAPAAMLRLDGDWHLFLYGRVYSDDFVIKLCSLGNVM